MKTKWKEYSDKFLAITPREQYLILGVGLALIFFVLYNLVLDQKLTSIDNLESQIMETEASIGSMTTTIATLNQSLTKDPNESINKQIEQYETKLKQIDSDIHLLASDLINPIQMRFALGELLKADSSVTLMSFEAITAQPLNLVQSESESHLVEGALSLYKHGLRLTLSGNYFALRDYLKKIESLSWKFFWHSFDYTLSDYPKGELVIEIYSLSIKKEFIGV